MGKKDKRKKEKTNKDTLYLGVSMTLDLARFSALFSEVLTAFDKSSPTFYDKITWAALSSNVEASSDILNCLSGTTYFLKQNRTKQVPA